MHPSESCYTAVHIIGDNHLVMPIVYSIRGHTSTMLACFRPIFDPPSTYTLVSIFATYTRNFLID